MSKTWLKHLLRTAAFLLALLVAVGLVGEYLKPHSNRYLTGYTAGGILGEDFDTIDVLVLGDSNAAQGIAPMEWYHQAGITGYTYGVGWFSVYNAYYRLRRIYDEQSPKVVVLGTAIIYSKKGNETRVQNAVGDIMDELFPLVRFHDNWKYLTPKNLLEEHDYTWRDINKGFTPLTGVHSYGGGSYMDDKGVAPIDPLVQLYLRRIVELCAQHDTKLVFVTVPCGNAWNMARHNGTAAFAAENGIPYVDYNLDHNLKAIGFDWQTDTPDSGDHLNVKGAWKVSQAMGHYLAANYALPDHRGEPGYQDWDADLAEYLANRQLQQASVETALAAAM
ncbi:MAG: hypothetical protein PHO10_06985 [Gemmiger sp.]|nr:hypothetical protein [Gemmiger sp.]